MYCSNCQYCLQWRGHLFPSHQCLHIHTVPLHHGAPSWAPVYQVLPCNLYKLLRAAAPQTQISIQLCASCTLTPSWSLQIRNLILRLVQNTWIPFTMFPDPAGITNYSSMICNPSTNLIRRFFLFYLHWKAAEQNDKKASLQNAAAGCCSQ